MNLEKRKLNRDDSSAGFGGNVITDFPSFTWDMTLSIASFGNCRMIYAPAIIPQYIRSSPADIHINSIRERVGGLKENIIRPIIIAQNRDGANSCLMAV